MEIREFQQSDLESIHLMSEQIVADGTVFPFENVEGVLQYWFSREASTHVAVIASDVVGTFVIKPNLPDRCSHIANAGYMVNENFRGQGIGRRMALCSIEIARELGYVAMQFNIVVATNLAAIHLWEELGFSTHGRIPCAFRLPDQSLVDVLIMHRTL